MKPIEIRPGDTVRMKKAHPCGDFDWQVEKVSFEVMAKCLGCGRQITLVRSKFEQRVKKVLQA